MSPDLTAAAELLRAAGWTVLPPPGETLPEPEVGQVWVSPKPKVAARTVLKLAPHRWYPSGDLCVYFRDAAGRESSLHPMQWRNWVRKAQARPA